MSLTEAETEWEISLLSSLHSHFPLNFRRLSRCENRTYAQQPQAGEKLFDRYVFVLSLLLRLRHARFNKGHEIKFCARVSVLSVAAENQAKAVPNIFICYEQVIAWMGAALADVCSICVFSWW